MTEVFQAKSANDIWLMAYKKLASNGRGAQGSRLGNTREILHANFHLEDPKQRWILSRMPPISPAFGIAEAFWILSGDNNANFLNYWNPILPKFAGTGDKYHGAYGYRIQKQFGFRQLEKAYYALKNNPDSRQVIILIWDPNADFPDNQGKPVDPDIPCNICSMPKIRNGKLEWLQIMRSNDLYRGTPYNFLQFTTIQEILSGWLNVQMGAYHHISDSLHIYENEINEVHVDETLKMPSNSDRLSLPKNVYDVQRSKLMESLYHLTSSDLTLKKFLSIIYDKSLTQSYKNLLMICAADSARRRKWPAEMNKAKSLCKNTLLSIAFDRWNERHPI